MNPSELLPQVYDELRKIAAAKLVSEQAGHTLNATALVHEAYLKLGGERSFASRTDYLRAAAQAMRRILVDSARVRHARKRDGGQRVEINLDQLFETPTDADFEAVDAVLARLAAQQPQLGELVQLRFFGGLTVDECAKVLGIASRTCDAWWSYARAWLSVELTETKEETA